MLRHRGVPGRSAAQRSRARWRDKGEDALLAGRLKQAAMERVFGFEILPAPFVVAHLQLGLFLQQHGAPLIGRAATSGRPST